MTFSHTTTSSSFPEEELQSGGYYMHLAHFADNENDPEVDEVVAGPRKYMRPAASHVAGEGPKVEEIAKSTIDISGLTDSILTKLGVKGSTTTSDLRPVIYTFFHPIDPSERSTGMDDESDQILLQAWQERWKNAGWCTQVLNLDDARRHPRYEEYFQRLQSVPMLGGDGKGRNRRYNELCFFEMAGDGYRGWRRISFRL